MEFALSIVIVNYKSSSVLKNCLKSILESELDIASEIIIVDNHSDDEGLPTIKIEYPKVNYIDMPINKGFAAACNVGIKESKGDVVLLLNPDTEVLPDTINKLYDYLMVNMRVGIVGPKIFYDDGNIQNKVIPKDFPNLWRMFCLLTGLDNLLSRYKMFNSYFGHNFDYDKVQEVKQVNGCCLMIKKDIINRIGLLDERYFLYFEETDWCLSTIKHGYKVIYFPSCSITHLEGKSSSILKKRSIEFYYESLIYFFRKNYSLASALALWLLLTSLLMVRLCLFFLIIFHHQNTNRFKEDFAAFQLCLSQRRILKLLKK